MTNPIRPLFAATLLAGCFPCGCAAGYSWQESQAEVLPSGDLRWQPRPFVFQAGAAVRFIDFNLGDDANPGDSKARPWKHHPWDTQATGLAKADAGRGTYIFKGGVIYRGLLKPTSDGTAAEPIILTGDPGWGEGEAVLAGSEPVTTWSRGGHPDMPEGDKVWHADLACLPRAVWVVTPAGTRRLALARSPNWGIGRWDDIHSQWATWKSVVQVDRDGEQVNRGEDPDLLGRYTQQQLSGAIVWSEYDGYMGTAYPTHLMFNPAAPGSVEFKRWVPDAEQWAAAHNRYFLEDRPAFLDAPGEFWFERNGAGGRLYVRLPGDQDPNTARIEAASRLAVIDATRLNHVRIRDLTFRFTNLQWDITDPSDENPDVEPAAIRLDGSGLDIDVDHCRFDNVACAVLLRAAPDDGGSIDDARITDNDVSDTDHSAFRVTDGVRWTKIDPPFGRLGRVAILRNRARRIGFRPYPKSHGHAIVVEFADSMEVAGNILDDIHGAGLFLFGGIEDGQYRDGPLSRHLVYQNRVSHPLLGTNDWGGIETWQAGPFYVFNNVSIDPGGFHVAEYLRSRAKPGPHTFRDSRFAFAYYFDGSSKNYVFNNIALGLDNDPDSIDCNAGAFYETVTQKNVFFNNSAARFAVAFPGFNRTASNSIFLGNVLEDMSLGGWYFSPPEPPKKSSGRHPDWIRRGMRSAGELAIAENLLAGQPAAVGSLPGTAGAVSTLPAFQAGLARLRVADARVGQIVPAGAIPRYAEGDFRLAPGSAALGHGVKFFVPWGLYACVAEWNFRPRNDDPGLVTDEHWYLTWGCVDREQYTYLPRHDLRGVGIARGDFVAGPLDDWTDSALRLDGVGQYLVLQDAALFRPKHAERTSYHKPGKAVDPRRPEWRTPDVGAGNFLIEAFLRPAPGRGGLILSKHDGRTGYRLGLDTDGRPSLLLERGGVLVARRAALASIADNSWHHLVVEVDRSRPDGITLWIDGRADGGPPEGRVTGADLDNPGDVLVAGGPGQPFFKGEIAFLRICLGTFAEARTTIDELRAWEFAGPQFADFTGCVPAAGSRRDAGALQHLPGDRN
jgi:hypothetical protein